MAQLRAKQLKLSNAGDMIVGDTNGNGSILPVSSTEGQALVVTNTGTDSAPAYSLAYDYVAGANVSYSNKTSKLTSTSVQGAIDELQVSISGLTGALVYKGTVDASTPTWTPALDSTVETGTYYQVTTAGNKIPTSVSSSTSYTPKAISLADAGTGYAVGDTVTIANAGTLTITGVTSGAISTYTSALSTTASATDMAGTGVSQTSTSGSGTGATFDITSNEISGSANETVSVGDAVVWNGTYWNVIAHIDTTVSGTAGTITVTGTPDKGYVATIDSTYVGQDSITTLGTITEGTWNGSDIDLAHGGTNTDLSSAADNSIVFKHGTGVEVTTPPSAGSTPAGAITTFTTTVSDTDPVTTDPTSSAVTVTGGKGSGAKASVSYNTIYGVNTVVINNAGSGYKSNDAITIQGLTGTLSVTTVDGKGAITALDASGITGNASNVFSTDPAGTGKVSAGGTGTGATFDVTSTKAWTAKEISVVSDGSGYASGDTLTVSASIGGTATTIGTISVTGVSAGSSGSGTTYLSFDPKTGGFVWANADDITGSAQQTQANTDQFTFVTGTVGAGQTAAGANAIVTLSHLPVVDSLEVFLNGLRLGSSDFTYAVSTTDATKGTIALVDSSMGYSADNNDVIEISYDFIAS